MKSTGRKRILCLLLCLAVLMPCASALSETTKVTGYLLRLRDEASTDGEVIDAFPRGTKVRILKKDSQVKKKMNVILTNLRKADDLAWVDGTSVTDPQMAQYRQTVLQYAQELNALIKTLMK